MTSDKYTIVFKMEVMAVFVILYPLLSLSVNGVFAAKTAIFLPFQPLCCRLFILPCRIIPTLAIRTRQSDNFTHEPGLKVKQLPLLL